MIIILRTDWKECAKYSKEARIKGAKFGKRNRALRLTTPLDVPNP